MTHQLSQPESIKPSEALSVKSVGNISYKKRREELNEVVKRHIEMKKQAAKAQGVMCTI